MLIYLIRFVSANVWFIFYPFFAIWLSQLHYFSVSSLGLIVSSAVVANRVGGILFTPLVRIFHKKNVIIVSQVFASLAYLLFFISYRNHIENIWLWVLAALMMGLANSVASLAQISYIGLNISTEKTHQAFSYENVAYNLSAGFAPLIASVLILAAINLFILIPILFAVLTLLLSFMLAPDVHSEQTNLFKVNFKSKFTVSQIILFLFVNFLTMYAYAQFYDVFPLFAKSYCNEHIIGVMFLLSSAAIVLLQLLVTKISNRYTSIVLLIGSNLLVAVGTWLLLGVAINLIWCVLGVVILTLAEMIYAPLYQAQALHIFNGEPVLSVALITCVWGVAEAAATYIGIFCVNSGMDMLSILLGALAGLMAAATMIGLRWKRSQQLAVIEEQTIRLA